MTQYSSREPFNDDPKPYTVSGENNSWRASETDARFMIDRPEAYTPRFSVKNNPRPEFERPQTNPTNPILAEFRSTRANYIDKRLCITHYLEYVTHNDIHEWRGMVAEKDHARRVLTRLANLKEES